MKKLFKKTAALTAAAALTAGLALTGCGSSSTSTSGEASAAADGSAAQEGGGTLRVTMALSEEEWEVMRNEVIPGFEEQYGVTVQADQIEAADVVKQIQAMNQAGDMQIDVIAQDANNLTSLVYDGLVEDLSEYQDLIPEEAMGSLAEAGVFDGIQIFLAVASEDYDLSLFVDGIDFFHVVFLHARAGRVFAAVAAAETAADIHLLQVETDDFVSGSFGAFSKLRDESFRISCRPRASVQDTNFFAHYLCTS